jgi:spermidine synthase
LKKVFTNVLVFPGGRIHFFATQRSTLLSKDPEILMERLKSRDIQTEYVREYYLPFRLMPDRLQDLEMQLTSQNEGRINTDFAPIAYYFDILLWSSRFHSTYRWLLGGIAQLSFLTLLLGALAISFTLVAWQWLKRDRESFTRRAVGSCVWAMGFTLLALEILILLGFQAVYGYVYYQLALIISAFMLGLAVGSWRSIRRSGQGSLHRGAGNPIHLVAWLQLAAATSSFLVCFFLYLLAEIDTEVVLRFASSIAFPLLAFLLGFLGGFQFPLATRLFFTSRGSRPANIGLLYGIDILGAWCASLVLSVVIFPLHGLFQTGILIAAVNSGPIVLASIAASRRRYLSPNTVAEKT